MKSAGVLPEDQSGHSLHDYLRIVRRRRWIILQALILLPLAATVFSLRQPKMYQASAEVLISRQNLPDALSGVSDPSQFLNPDRLTETQAELARVPEVPRRTLKSVGSTESVSGLLAHSSVTTQANSDLLTFSVTDHSPSLAARLATAYANQFTLYRQQLDTASLNRARDEVGAKIQELAASGGRGSSLYTTLVEKDQQLATLAALQTSNVSLVKPATGAAQVQPKPVRNAVLGLVLGLVVGIALAFLWEALDTRVRTAEEIAERLGLPLLARLPEPPRRLRKDNRLVMLAEPRAFAAEPFRMLRTNLEFARIGGDIRTILITSSVEQEGKSTTVANLATALARGGQRVALVDLDLRRPYLDRFFDLESRPGLSEVVIGHVSLDEALFPIGFADVGKNRSGFSDSDYGGGNGNSAASHQPRGIGGAGGSLHVMVAGPIPPNAGEFVTFEPLVSIIAELRKRFDLVLIDTPPALHVGDAMALSRHVDGLIVVTRINVVRRTMLRELRRHLEGSQAAKLGFVVTGAQEEEGYGSGYGSWYSYSFGYDPDRSLKAPPEEVTSA